MSSATLWLFTAWVGSADPQSAAATSAPQSSAESRKSAAADLKRRNTRRFVRGHIRGVVLDNTWIGGTYLCGDLKLGRRFELVGCGSGSGFLYPKAGGRTDNELAHFRLDWSAFSRGGLRLLLGVGIAEAEFGADLPGFVFAPDRTRDPPEAAGPEVAAGFDVPIATSISLLRVRIDAGVAWIPGLPTIAGLAPAAPFAVLTANAQF